MQPTDKTLIRAAVLIHEQLSNGPIQKLPIHLPDYSWDNIRRLRRQIDRARQRGWCGAVTRLTVDLSYAIDSCRRDLENAHRALQPRCEQRRFSTVADIHRDFLALDDEFDTDEMYAVVDFEIAVGLPVTLAELDLEGVGRERLVPIGDICAGEGSLCHNHPFPVTSEDVVDAMIAADALGRQRKDLGGIID